MTIKKICALVFVVLINIMVVCSCKSRLDSSQQSTKTVIGVLKRSSPIPSNSPCPSKTPQPIPSNSPYPNETPQMTPVLFPKYTLPPTLPPNQEETLFDLLHNENCKLPCYLNIIPGETSFQEAKAILESVGAIYLREYSDSDSPIHSYVVWIGDSSMVTVTPDWKRGLSDQMIGYHINIKIEDYKVQRIQAYTFANRLADKAQEYWSEYSLRKVFLLLGKPDEIGLVIHPTYSGITIVYENPKVTFEQRIRINEMSICPSHLNEYLDFKFTLTSPSSEQYLYLPGDIPLNKSILYLPITEVLGTTEEEFYNQVISTPTACFEIKQKNTSP